MRYPLNTIYVTGKFREVAVPGTGLPDASGVKRHIGVDLRASVGTPIYAPGAGTVTLVDNVGLKLVEIRIDTMLHRFLHLDRNVLSTGQSVAEGQLIGYSGNTGGVAAHLHWDVRKNGTSYNASLNNYVDPMSLITNQGEEMFKTDAEVREAYLLLRGSIGTQAERNAWINQPKQRFFQVGKPEADSTRKQLADVKKALSDLQAQPPKEIVKIVKEIVEVPVEKITVKEVEVVREVEKPATWQTVIDFIRSAINKFLRKEQ